MTRPRGSQIIDAKAFGERARQSFRALRDAYQDKRMPRVTVRTVYWRVRDFDETVNESTVGRWVAGQSVPESRERIKALARALEVDPDWLAGGDEGLSLTTDAAEDAADVPVWPRVRERESGEGKRPRGRRRASGR